MTGGPPVFNCGEFKPLRYTPVGGPTIPEPNIFIPIRIDPKPIRGPDPVIPWVCICRGDITTNGGCSNESSRECVRVNEAGGFPQSDVEYASKEQCESDAYSRRPCALSIFECTRQQRPCPPQTPIGSISIGACSELAPVAFRPSVLPEGFFTTLNNCILNCRNINDCRGPIITGDPDLSTPGTVVVVSGYECRITPSSCPETGIAITIRECIRCVVSPRNPNCINQPLSECETYCRSDECKNKCIPYQIKCPNTTVLAQGTRCAPCKYDPTDPLTVDCNLPDCIERCTPPVCPPITLGNIRVLDEPIIIVTTGTTGTYSENRWRCLGNGTCVQCTTGEIRDGYCPYLSKIQCQANCSTRPQTPQIPVLQDPIRYKCVEGTCVRCTFEEATINPNLCRYSTDNCNNECIVVPNTITYKGIIQDGVRQCAQCISTPTNPNICPYPTLRDCALAWLINPDAQDAVTLTFKPSMFLERNESNINVIELGLNNEDVVDTGNFVEDKTKDTNIYDPIYNFFNYPPNETTRYVRNSYYLNIFNEYVSEEVFTFLDRNFNNSNYWNEKLFSDLTLAKISISLRPELLAAFNNIRNIDGTLTNAIDFYEAVRKLLITNKLNEFDPSFYISLYEQQKEDVINELKFSDTTEVTQRAALGILSEGSLSVDANNYTDINKFKILRQKRLNTDINTRIKIYDIQDEVTEVPLENAGLTVTGVDATDTSAVPLGVGEGYFISYTDVNSNNLKIPLDTEQYRAYLAPENVRYIALKSFSQSPDIVITASSLSGQHEFIDSYELSSVIGPMYFALNLYKVEDAEKLDPLVDRVRAEYNLLTDNTEIQNHVYNYGYSVIRINLDFRDPLLHYAKDTSTLLLEQNDITFRYFDLITSGTLNSNSILTRNLPFGIVIVPGCGSRHNPFNGMSELNRRLNNKVVRSLTFTSLYNPEEKNLLAEPTVLSSVETTPIETNLPEDQYGYANKFYYVYNQNKYTGTYYYNGVYQSNEPEQLPKTKPVTSYLVNNIIDNLIQGYSPKELKWFDVFSRLNLNQMGELQYVSSEDLMKSLEEGERGVLIKPVLRTEKEIKSYIDPTVVPEIEVPDPIITKENRYNA
jgi:hypothetical protein